LSRAASRANHNANTEPGVVANGSKTQGRFSTRSVGMNLARPLKAGAEEVLWDLRRKFVGGM